MVGMVSRELVVIIHPYCYGLDIVFLQKTHALKAWSPAGGATERWLDHESANFINGTLAVD
jgi:hypothetical protein